MRTVNARIMHLYSHISPLSILHKLDLILWEKDENTDKFSSKEKVSAIIIINR